MSACADGYTHMGTLYYYHACADTAEQVLQLNEKTYDNMMVGASRAFRGVCIRALAYSAQDIEKLFGRP